MEFKRKREFLENQNHHDLGMKRRLEGERLRLLTTMTPVDRHAWHSRVMGLLDEKMDLLEQIKIGRIVPPSGRGLDGFTFSTFAEPRNQLT